MYKSRYVKGRDIYEVANQLAGYVGPDTPERLSVFLLRESEAASDLAEEIERLDKLLGKDTDTCM